MCMKKITFFLMAAFAAVCLSVSAQEVVKTWNFEVWSQETVANFVADSESASPIWVQGDGTPLYPDFSPWARARNNVTLTANTNLTANGVEIEELKGVFFWAVTSSNLNIRFNYGSAESGANNGIQFGSSNQYFGLADLTEGQIVKITFVTASSGTSRGISGITNLTGPTGADNAYASDDPVTLTYTVVADGNVRWTYNAGIILKKIELLGSGVEAPTLSLSSGAKEQSVYAGQSITDIVYRWGGTATSASVTWDEGTTPAGIDVTPNTEANTITISGAPTAEGTYGYSVVSTDGTQESNALTGTITVRKVIAGATKIAYITQTDGDNVTDAADKAVLEILRETYEVYVIKANATTDAALPRSAFDEYDAVVLAALPGSGNVPTCLKGIDKPLVSVKPFMMQSSRWNWGSPVNLESASSTKTLDDVPKGVAVEDATHPIFKGMELSNNDVVELATNSKHGSFRILTPMFSWLGDNAANIITLATVPEGDYNYNIPSPGSGTDASGMPVIFEIIPNSVMNDGTVITQKTIHIGVSEQADGPDNNSVTYYTPKLLTIIKNAVDYVLGGDDVGIQTPVVDSNKVVVNKAYFDITGRRVSAGSKGLVIEKLYYEDGTTGCNKVFIRK